MSRADQIEELIWRTKQLLQSVPFFPSATDLKSLTIDRIVLNEGPSGIWISLVTPMSGYDAYDVVFSEKPDHHINVKWRYIEDLVLPILRRETVLDDLADA